MGNTKLLTYLLSVHCDANANDNYSASAIDTCNDNFALVKSAEERNYTKGSITASWWHFSLLESGVFITRTTVFISNFNSY